MGRSMSIKAAWRPRVAADVDRRVGGLLRARRSLGLTAALTAVLCCLAVFTVWGALQLSQAVDMQRRALVHDEIFEEARTAVATQELAAHEYQLEPSVVSRDRYVDSGTVANDALRQLQQNSLGRDVPAAQRLRTEQADYRSAADRLIQMVANDDPSATQQYRLQVMPAYYTLQHDIDTQSRAYHHQAQRLVADLQQVQTRIFAIAGLGFVVGLALVAMIWRTMLGYQQRLFDLATASQHQALHDPLTGLANRLLFEQQIGTAIRDGDPRSRLAVILIDLNGFKNVNDTLGHQAGDEVLVETGHRLQAVCRVGDTVARLGGDEFAVLLPEIDNAQEACGIAQRAVGALRRNYLIAAGSAAISGSAGLAIGSRSTGTEDMLRNADAAMYRAKTAGNGIAIYDPEIDTDQPHRMALFGELRALLDGDETHGRLVLHYQPQVRISDATVTAAEALVRWQHPAHGLLRPDAFLAVAETGGLEIPLTYRILRTAVADAAQWRTPAHPVTVSVNVSPVCLLDDAFVHEIRSALAAHSLPASRLRLEITESAMAADPCRANATLSTIRADGVQVSIDDYGTGFSSLGQLKQLVADELKIDRTFVHNLATDPADAVLVGSAIDLAHNLGLFVTAEGVENLEALAVLRRLDCDQAQGFALGYPVSADGLLAECRRAHHTARGLLGPPPVRSPADDG
jgi:diguanylate cyclase (GGDEF)-like protein